MTLIVVANLSLIAPKVLESHDLFMELQLAELEEDFGLVARSPQIIYASYLLPPIIGFALAMVLRRYTRSFLLRNQAYFKKEIRRRLTMRTSVGIEYIREDLSNFPRFIPLIIAIIFVFALDVFISPGNFTVMSAFVATSGFLSYPKWKEMFLDATSHQDSDEVEGIDIEAQNVP